MRCKSVFVIVFALFFISFASASFNFSENGSSINNQYGTSDYVKARINISFQNESLNSTFRDSLGNSIKLGDLLNITVGYDYAFNDGTNTSINSGFHILQFDKANFILPESKGNFTYQLNFSGKQIFKEKFLIISTDNTVKERIDDMWAKLDASKNEIKKYNLYVQKILNESINIPSLENDLKSIEAQYKIASTDEEYTQILENLSYIKIPEEISENVNTNPITFYPSREAINLEVLNSIDEKDYGSNGEAYIDAIYAWNRDNLNTTMTFKEILINYGPEENIIIRIFQFNFDKTNMNNEAYFIIENLEDLKFYENYSQTEESGYTYINLNAVSDNLVFSTTEDVNFLDVPAFISPSLNNLNPVTVGLILPDGSKLSKWVLLGLILFLLILIAIVAYIILQTWYRRKYENYLFKNRNNLYNIMTYIQNAKKRGMERDAIMKNLKKAEWNREQINYALRKYEGKKIIGIIERPFKKVIEDIEKRPRENPK